MAKRLFLLLFGLLGMMNMPIALTAADNVILTGVSDAKAVETVPLPEPEPEVAIGQVQTIADNTMAIRQEYVPIAPRVINYTVTVWIGSETEYVNTAQSLSESDIYKFRKMVYAHNRPHLMQSITNLKPGDLFTVTEGAMAQTYVVVESSSHSLANGVLDGDAGLMRRISYAMGHDLAMMTCYGDSGRWVVVADKV